MCFIRKVFLFFLLTSCSTTQDNPDPHREFNKDALEFNLIVDKNILKPVSSTYKKVTPDPVRESISNFLINSKEPFFFLNYLITAEAENAANSLFRFLINSTFGVLGFFDVGERIGLKKNETSYKKTLKKLSIPTGDYLVLPVLGSSSTRDAIAEPISWFANPVGYFIGFPYMFAMSVLSIIHERAENSTLLDSTIRDAINIYAITRSLYLQKYGFPELDIDADSY
ncbi:MAG: VacJ family lipoprotein [Holosporaceae bacterium]|jgi:phospholipid-binding lipoprotein MlaA|nr:VacJ family lipoprotein [Holosporaceae bacterium]